MANGSIELGYDTTFYELTPISRTFSINDVESSRQRRTQNGTLLKDVRYTKKTFIIRYRELEIAYINTLLILYNRKSELTLKLELDDSGFQYQYTVFMEPLQRTRDTIIGTTEYWLNLTVTLREV